MEAPASVRASPPPAKWRGPPIYPIRLPVLIPEILGGDDRVVLFLHGGKPLFGVLVHPWQEERAIRLVFLGDRNTPMNQLCPLASSHRLLHIDRESSGVGELSARSAILLCVRPARVPGDVRTS